MRIFHGALIFRVKLGAEEERMAGNFHDFHELGFGVYARGFHACGLEGLLESAVELVEQQDSTGTALERIS